MKVRVLCQIIHVSLMCLVRVLLCSTRVPNLVSAIFKSSLSARMSSAVTPGGNSGRIRSGSRVLVVFDFDQSLTEGDSNRLSRQLGGDKVKDLRNTYGTSLCPYTSWTELMGATFAMSHEAGVTRLQFEEHMRAVVIHNDMATACRLLGEDSNVDCAILSDCNSVFIELILEKYGLQKVFKNVVTNPARFNDEGRLLIEHCHQHSCKRCPENLCKGAFMDTFLSEMAYSKVAYIGDGGGDVCAALSLVKGDTVLARDGYPLQKKLVQSSELQADLSVWNNGTDVLEWMKTNVHLRQ